MTTVAPRSRTRATSGTPRGLGSRPGRLGALLRQERLLGVLLILLVIALWELGVRSGRIASPSIPAPSVVLQELGEGMTSGALPGAIWATLRKFFIGFALAAVVGIPLGTFMARSRIVYGLLEPVTELIRPIPGSAYIPIAVLVLGIGDEMKIAVTAVAAFFPILLNTYDGVRGCDVTLLDTGRTFRLSGWQTLRKVVLPAAMPQVLTGMRISLGIAFVLITVSEMLAGNEGLGFYIIDAQRSFRPPEMFAGILVLAVVGFSMNYCFVRISGRLLRWRHAGSD